MEEIRLSHWSIYQNAGLSLDESNKIPVMTISLRYQPIPNLYKDQNVNGAKSDTLSPVVMGSGVLMYRSPVCGYYSVGTCAGCGDQDKNKASDWKT